MPPKHDRAARLCYVLCSNAGLAYGIGWLGWGFFPVLYLFWWEELVTTFFSAKKLRALRPFLLEKETETDVLAREGGVAVRYFFLFVWLVFVVVCGVFVLAPQAEWGANLRTLFLRDWLFNLNLAGFAGLQLLSFWPRFLEKNRPSAAPDEVARFGQMMDRRGVIIHVGMLVGIFLGMLVHPSGFAWGFLFVKLVGDIVGVFFDKSPAAGSQPLA